MQRLITTQTDFNSKLEALLAFDPTLGGDVEHAVNAITEQVRVRGDAALLEYTQRFDGISVTAVSELRLGRDELERAFLALSEPDRDALRTATQRIRTYHEHQKATSWRYTDEYGSILGQIVTPLDRVGIYVPGGKAAYPSSVLMNAIPAKVAGVEEIIMAVPTPRGEKNELVLAAAYIAGVDQVFTMGGAQAIAALAYGTQTIPAVDKITGPGNAYVAAAKRKVFGVVGIDMIAGPSEILILCDGTTDPDWIAMDLFSQAEHDEVAQAILIATSAEYLDRVSAAIDKLLPTMPRAEIISASLRNRGALICAADPDEACEIANRIAPEHLELSVEFPDQWLPKLRHAGAIFIGKYSSESLGDYCAGPNHVLPTSRTARFASPLGVYDFQKRTSLLDISHPGAQALGVVADRLATGEGLAAHAASARMRLDK
ncbi:histidinol dehydrogenase [Parachitinimonas caeni]|uniref:Histidinol dehydrogenase n=1 Tax=Parachitinimonas caeni TaxID=3031301 RepID=A0ABT7DT56_9NEIS|nr:histidinol dehydrogenase [Parachitinimonas caeni]MDK2123149.1 histidinol dehydrogenase [Parachitinimonas caeni]